jgi:hypothetical protein
VAICAPNLNSFLAITSYNYIFTQSPACRYDFAQFKLATSKTRSISIASPSAVKAENTLAVYASLEDKRFAGAVT